MPFTSVYRPSFFMSGSDLLIPSDKKAGPSTQEPEVKASSTEVIMKWLWWARISDEEADEIKSQETGRDYHMSNNAKSAKSLDPNSRENKFAADPNRRPGTIDLSEMIEAFEKFTGDDMCSGPYDAYKNSNFIALLKVIREDFGRIGAKPGDPSDLFDDRGGVRPGAMERAEGMLFERMTAGRPAAPAPIDVPKRVRPELCTMRTKGPRPLEDLYLLDQHIWDTEGHILAKWARGAGVGRDACSITDEYFRPCSPPGNYRELIPHHMYCPPLDPESGDNIEHGVVPLHWNSSHFLI